MLLALAHALQNCVAHSSLARQVQPQLVFDAAAQLLPCLPLSHTCTPVMLDILWHVAQGVCRAPCKRNPYSSYNCRRDTVQDSEQQSQRYNPRLGDDTDATGASCQPALALAILQNQSLLCILSECTADKSASNQPEGNSAHSEDEENCGRPSLPDCWVASHYNLHLQGESAAPPVAMGEDGHGGGFAALPNVMEGRSVCLAQRASSADGSHPVRSADCIQEEGTVASAEVEELHNDGECDSTSSTTLERGAIQKELAPASALPLRDVGQTPSSAAFPSMIPCVLVDIFPEVNGLCRLSITVKEDSGPPHSATAANPTAHMPVRELPGHALGQALVQIVQLGGCALRVYAMLRNQALALCLKLLQATQLLPGFIGGEPPGRDSLVGYGECQGV